MATGSARCPLRRGLVLGKFAPLHRGHQYLIETALAAVDELVALVYESNDVTDVPLAVRAGWIRQLYPAVQVIEGHGGPAATGRDAVIMRLQEAYIRRVVPMRITHFFSSEWYGDHVSAALGAENMVVDSERRTFPVSGTAVRADPYTHRAWIHPLVYWDLLRKVVFLGAESTGKTTIAQALAERFETQWMPEYGREHWERHHDAAGVLTPAQLVELAREHRRREAALAWEARRVLFVDTNAITTEMFARFYHDHVEPELLALAREAERRYDLTFVCSEDIPYDEDGTRSGAAHRRRFQREIVDDLAARGVPYATLAGSLPDRIGTVEAELARRWGIIPPA